MKRLLSILFLSLSLSACSFGPALDEGEVVGKEHEESRTYPVVTIVNKIPMTQIHRDDEDWYLVVQGEKDGETIERRLPVSEEAYSRYEIGDWYSSEKD